MNNHDELKQRVSKQVDRMQKADKDRPTLLAQTAYLGTLGLLLVIPVIGGAYLGRWLDGLVEGYSIRWTLSLIIVGVAVGAINVYLFIKD
ncbi:MAG: Sodium-transporting ATPase subunit Q [Nitrospira sp.]|jgi:ATP synthase protein I|nr:Sodium-transporting ATPase subunit Q [Nitrospira sp.]